MTFQQLSYLVEVAKTGSINKTGSLTVDSF